MIAVHTVSGAFSAAECGLIVQTARDNPASDARLVGDNRNHNMRRAELVWLDDVPGTEWIMDRFIDVVRDANRETFGFDLTEFAESAQVARYGEERMGHFDWHADIGEGRLAAKRKLTIVVQLSQPQHYEGGLLEVMPSAAIHTADQGIGTATLFPSFLLHRVTPVTKGERHSMTLWSHGPAFR